jgi:hypothetical protein
MASAELTSARSAKPGTDGPLHVDEPLSTTTDNFTESDLSPTDRQASSSCEQFPQTIAIGIHPARDLMRRAIDLQAIFTLLDTMGALTVSTRLDALPAPEELDPADCYLGFDIMLKVDGRCAALIQEEVSDLLRSHLKPSEYALQTYFGEAQGMSA